MATWRISLWSLQRRSLPLPAQGLVAGIALRQDAGDPNHLNVGYAEFPDVKQYHLLQLDNGNYGAYPNNYLRVWNADFVDRDSDQMRLRQNTTQMWAEDQQ